MREFAQTLSEFTKGLRPDANMPRNSGFATELYNTRCGVAGLEVPPLIINPIVGAPVVSWPLPQLVKISDLYLTDSGIYLITYTGGYFSIYSVAATTYALTLVYTGTGKSEYGVNYVWNGVGTWINAVPPRFTIADFGYYQIWSHPALTVKRAINDELTAYEWSRIIVGLNGSGHAPPVRCICNFRGQLIAGMYSYSAETPGDTLNNFVAWSEIGSVTPLVMFTDSQYFIDRRTSGGLAIQPYKRTSGNYKTGPTSVVHRVLPLGNGVMVYCSNKIFYMKAVSLPEPTFGIVPIADFGIPSTFCAEGDEDGHIFVSSNKEVWRVKEGPKLERLGYKEYMDLLTGIIVISKNPNFGDYYISDGTKTYLLSQYGLSQWFQYPTSLVWEDTNKRLIGPIAVGADVSAYMASDVFDFGVRGLKTLTVMEIGSTGQVMTANVDYKYKVTDSAFTASRFKTASGFGAVTPLVSGTEFKMRIKGADYTKFDLDYLTVRYKYVDKRMIRGVYATDAKVLSRSGR